MKLVLTQDDGTVIDSYEDIEREDLEQLSDSFWSAAIMDWLCKSLKIREAQESGQARFERINAQIKQLEKDIATSPSDETR